MTTGERINFYRKKLGLSQEELGQKLLVSRQTVSLWEKDQTVPTIDNLIRLKEIFEVSVDELLGCSDDIKEDADIPLESYFMSYSNSEINKLSRLINKPLITRFIITLVITFFFFSSMDYAQETFPGVAIIFGVFVAITFSLIKAAVFNYRSFKTVKNRLLGSSYEYNVYENYFTVTVLKNGEFTAKYQYNFEKVDKLRYMGNYLLLSVDGGAFVLRKESLKANSMFFLMKNYSKENAVTAEKRYTLYKTILMILFIASLLSLFFSMIIGTIMSESHIFFQSPWAFFVVLPIPVASLIAGIIFKKRGYRCKKNIVAGIVFTVLLCIYGIGTFQTSEMYDHSDTAIVKVEEALGIDFPESKQIDTQNLSDSEQTSKRGFLYYTSDVYFAEADVENFEKEIGQNSIWLKSVPNNLIGITSPLSEFYKGSYFIVYNVDTKQINKLPEDSGKYRFYYIAYDDESDSMKIDEYVIDYVK